MFLLEDCCFDCSDEGLFELGELSWNTLFLRCPNNLLVLLPRLPVHLNLLDCSYNRLVHLGPLPKISDLRCQKNLLVTMPRLPPGVHYVDCSDNFIEYLPPLNYGLCILRCYGNPLKTQLLKPQENLFEL